MKIILLLFTISYFTFAQDQSENAEITNISLKKKLDSCSKNYEVSINQVKKLIEEINSSNDYIIELKNIIRKQDSLINRISSLYETEILNKKKLDFNSSSQSSKFDCSKNKYTSLGTFEDLQVEIYINNYVNVSNGIKIYELKGGSGFLKSINKNGEYTVTSFRVFCNTNEIEQGDYSTYDKNNKLIKSEKQYNVISSFVPNSIAFDLFNNVCNCATSQ